MEIPKHIGTGFGKGELYDVLVQLQNMAILTQSKVFYVWKSGNNTTGESWETAFTTITAAITAHTAYRAGQVNKSVNTYIIIAPATYDENITVLPYSCHMIGLGHIGTDKATEISPTEGIALAGTVSGLHLYNIRFEGEGSGDICDFGTFNCSIVENCQFVPKSASMASAISTDDCKETIFRNNHFTTGGALYCDYGLKFNGGADKYCHNTLIEGNIINGAVKAAGTGIYLQDTCTTSGTVIRNNIIRLTGAGIGIDDDSDGCMVVGNKIFTQAGTWADCNTDLAIDNLHNNGTTVTAEPNVPG